MAAYPSSIVSLTTKNDGDTIFASHVDALQDEVIAIETALLNGLQHDLKFIDATYDIGKSGATRPRDGFFSRDFTVGRDFSFGGNITATGQYRVSAFHNTTQSINDSTDTALAFNSEDYDVVNLHDTVTNNSRVTVLANGLYHVTASVSWAANATGSRLIKLKKNGATLLKRLDLPATSGALSVSQQIAFDVVLLTNDYIEVIVYQSSGGALNAGSANRESSNDLQVLRLW